LNLNEGNLHKALLSLHCDAFKAQTDYKRVSAADANANLHLCWTRSALAHHPLVHHLPVRLLLLPSESSLPRAKQQRQGSVTITATVLIALLFFCAAGQLPVVTTSS